LARKYEGFIQFWYRTVFADRETRGGVITVLGILWLIFGIFVTGGVLGLSLRFAIGVQILGGLLTISYGVYLVESQPEG